MQQLSDTNTDMSATALHAAARRRAILRVTGMTCNSCVATIEREAAKVPGVESVSVGLLLRKAEVVYSASPSGTAAPTPQSLCDTIEAIGFEAAVEADDALIPTSSHRGLATTPSWKAGGPSSHGSSKARLADRAADAAAASAVSLPRTAKATISVGGMTCSACVSIVENGVKSLPGVVSVAVALVPAGRAVVQFYKDGSSGGGASAGDTGGSGTVTTVDQIVTQICDLGYDAHLVSVAEDAPVGEAAAKLTRGSPAPPPTMLAAVTLVVTSMAAGGIHGGGATATQSQPVSEAVTGRDAHASVEAAVRRALGVEADATVRLPRGILALKIDPDVVGGGSGVILTLTLDVSMRKLRRVIDALADAGLAACIQSHTGAGAPLGGSAGSDTALMQRDNARERAAWRRLVIESALLTIPIFIISMVLMWIDPMITDGWGDVAGVAGLAVRDVTLAALTFPIQFVIGWRFIAAAGRGLRRCHMGMDFLVATGTTAAYAASVLQIALNVQAGAVVGPTFFETSALLITFVVLGKYLEIVARGRTSDALAALLTLQPDEAVVELEDEEEATWWRSSQQQQQQPQRASPADLTREDGVAPADGALALARRRVPLALVSPGDLLRVLPGGAIPTDGIVHAGAAEVDEAMVTGESSPVRKALGDDVVGGTISRGPGVLLVRATRVGGGTVLSQIVRLVESAQLTKAPIQVCGMRDVAVCSVAAPCLQCGRRTMHDTQHITSATPLTCRPSPTRSLVYLRPAYSASPSSPLPAGSLRPPLPVGCRAIGARPPSHRSSSRSSLALLSSWWPAPARWAWPRQRPSWSGRAWGLASAC